MKRPVLPLFEPEVMAARLRQPNRDCPTTAARHVVFAGTDVRSMRGSANELYHLMNIVEELDLRRSYMIQGLACRGDIELGYVAEIWDCDEEDTESAARYLKEHLPPGSALDVVTDMDDRFVMSAAGAWARVGR